MKTTHLALTLVLAACGDGITTDAQPIVSVLKQDGGCFALMAGDAVDPLLGVAGTCPYRADTRLLAGIDFAEVVIDYGPDVPFAGTTVAPPPTVVVTVDGAASGVPVSMSDEFRLGERAYYLATFRAPAMASTDVRVIAGVNAGFQTTVPEVFSIVEPQVEVVLLECQQANCQLPGATGSAHVHVAVPGTVPQEVTIHSAIGGVPQPDPVPPVKTFVNNNRTENVVALPVPAASHGTVWSISAQVGSGPLTMVDAMIQAPTITTELTCGQQVCSLDTGDPVGLEILTAAEIRPLEALVTTRLDGIPQLVDARVPLSVRADGTAHGALGLTVPDRGTWQIDVTVAGYPADTIVTAIP